VFRRPLSYFERRFHEKQEEQWLAYKAGCDLVLPWGRRSGKSDLFAEIFIEDLEDYGKPCLYLASTQKSAREIMWPKFKTRLRGNKDWRLNDQRLEAIYTPADAPVRLGGIENIDDLAGKAYRVVVADEFALWKKKHTTPQEIIKLIIAPMLADFDGQLLYGSSKRGKNQMFDIHQRALGNREKYFVNEATIFDNPFVSESGRNKVIQEYDGVDDPLYRQEILNEYVTFQGMVFALDVESYTENRWDPADLDHSYHIRGVDHGFSPDPTAAVWIAWNHRKGHWLVYNEYKQAKLLIHQHADIINSLEHYPIADTFSDVDPQVIAEYEAVGLPMDSAAKADKQGRLLKIVNALRSGRLKIAKNCKMLLKEMSSYEWDQDGNDHLIDALNYGYTNSTIPPQESVDKRDSDPRLRVKEPTYQDSNGQDFGD
jgi:hypothetical protein